MQSYERRGKVVKEGKEAALWADITPEMMSEEDKQEDVYIRHAPSYRSDSLNRFLEKLDQRLESEINMRKHPRLKRKLGSPRKKAVPPGCKKWMVKRTVTVGNAEQVQKDDQGMVEVGQDLDSIETDLSDYSDELVWFSTLQPLVAFDNDPSGYLVPFFIFQQVALIN